MNKNLGWKLILIIAVLLVFLYGIFGIPRVLRPGLLTDLSRTASTLGSISRAALT